jgi:ASC-1-like (ASCH) protein
MQEIGVETTVLHDILAGKKTIEGRLGKDKFLKLRAGDIISLRQDVWKDGKIITSQPTQATIRITQVLYFTSFREMLESLDFEAIIPNAESIDDAMAAYRQFYTEDDEDTYGVVAFIFELE